MSVSAPTEIAWLFVRGEESVRLEVIQAAEEFQLDVWGPGRARASYRFNELAAATTAVEAHQQELLGEGFVLQARAERRAASDRGRHPRVRATERRKR